MNYFFGFEQIIEQEIRFFFNLNHLIFVFLMVLVLLALYFGVNSTTKKGIRRTLLALGFVLFALEAGRLIWIAAENAHLGLPFGLDFWVSTFPFSYCGVMSITTAVVLIVTAFKKNTQTIGVQTFYNIIFGLGMLGGLITFSAPGIFDYRFPLLHFRNFQTVAVHLLLIFVPLYLIKIERLQISLRNAWMAAAGFLGTASILMTVSQISGENRGWALYIEEMVIYAGVYIPFPWHLFVLFLALFSVTLIFYVVLGRKRIIKPAASFNIYIIICGLTVATIGILLIPLTFPQSPVENALGLLCLIPLAIIIATIALARKKNTAN